MNSSRKQSTKPGKASNATKQVPTTNVRSRQRKSNLRALRSKGAFSNATIGQNNSAAAAYSVGQKSAEPIFKSVSARGCRIVHRELVGSITGSSTFAVPSTYPLNPGLAVTFPWLSVEAQGWEQYVFRKLRFCYYTRCATSVPGSIMLVPDYDAADAAPASEQIASSYRDVVEEVPWTIEFCCELDPKAMMEPATRKFIRTGALAANLDIKTYDSGNLFVCTTDGTAVNWGKLWVEYDVEFFVPQLPPLGVSVQNSASITGVSVSASSYYGTTPTIVGGLQVTATVDTVTFNTPGQYLFTFNIQGSSLGLSGTPFSGSTGAVTWVNTFGTENGSNTHLIEIGCISITAVGQTLVINDGGASTITSVVLFLAPFAVANY